jgi:hypothetical protein
MLNIKVSLSTRLSDTCGLMVGEVYAVLSGERRSRSFPYPRRGVRQGRSLPDKLYSPWRVLYPLKRQGRKGVGIFHVLPGNRLDEITLRYGKIIATYCASPSCISYADMAWFCTIRSCVFS